MALDSRLKRASVIGVARGWYRNSHPSSLSPAQRAGIGQAYSGLVYAAEAALWTLQAPPADGFSKASPPADGWSLETEPSDGWVKQ